MVLRPRVPLVTAVCILGLATAIAAGCASPTTAEGGTNPPAQTSASTRPTKSPTTEEATTTPTPDRLRIAFAGDVHFEDQVRTLLDSPDTALDPIRPALERADVTMVNLETAIATGDTPEPKNYTFKADPTALDALAAAGVDVVTMANNHGVDYGSDGLAETLDAAADGPVGVVGIGSDSDRAFAPYVVDVAGRRVAFLGATAFPDPTTDNWPAGADTPGVAVAIEPTRLLEEVRAARQDSDVVVVYVHWGIERVACPTAEQRELAGLLAEAGADVVVGSHAHVQLGAGMLADTYVAYGLGNFVWYSRNSTAEGTTGVLELTLDGRRVVDSSWTPALVGSDGVPRPADADDAPGLIEEFAALRECTDLAPSPGLGP